MARQALISRSIDFWLLGGLSLLVLLIMVATRNWITNGPRDAEFWFALGAYLRVGLEYPHLLATYKLAYGRGGDWIRRHLIAAVLAPGVILILGILAFLALEPGWFGPTWRQHSFNLVGAGIHLLFFAFGWHRLRQVWGCMVLYGRYDGLKLCRRRRVSVHSFLISMWIMGYFVFMNSTRNLNFFGFPVSTFAIPPFLLWTSAALFFASGLFFLYEIIWRVARDEHRLPSLNFLVPILAILFWWAAVSLEPAFFFFLAPSFHSLQYLAVVWAFERGPWTRKWQWRQAVSPLGMFALFLLLGWIWDGRTADSFSRGSAAIAIAYIVVSLHHYLLDGVIWRTSDPRLKNLLD